MRTQRHEIFVAEPKRGEHGRGVVLQQCGRVFRATEHERWIVELFGGLDAKTVQQLHQTLGQLRVQMLPDTRPEETRS